MLDYRAYIMGPDGHIQNRVELRCDDDVEAIRLAKQVVDGHDVELWQDIQAHVRAANPEAIDYSRWRSLISDSA